MPVNQNINSNKYVEISSYRYVNSKLYILLWWSITHLRTYVSLIFDFAYIAHIIYYIICMYCMYEDNDRFVITLIWCFQRLMKFASKRRQRWQVKITMSNNMHGNFHIRIWTSRLQLDNNRKVLFSIEYHNGNLFYYFNKK